MSWLKKLLFGLSERYMGLLPKIIKNKNMGSV